MFEATVQVELVEGGRRLARQVVNASCGTGCRRSFADGFSGVHTSIDPRSQRVLGPGGTPVVLRASWISPKDGSKQDTVEREVTTG